MTRVRDGIRGTFCAWWVCPRIVENSGLFLEQATPEPHGVHSIGHGYPVPEGWLCQYQITWLRHLGANAVDSRAKLCNDFYACCHNDGISLEPGEVMDLIVIEMVKKWIVF